MKYLAFFVVFLFCIKTTNAQYDTIVMVTGQKLPAIVKEISDKYIKYKNPKDSLGPTLVIKKKLIERFILRNGCIEMKEIGYDNCVKDPTYGVLKEDEFKRRMISFDFAQLAMSNVQTNMEYVFKKRNIGIVFLANKGLLDPKKISKYEYSKSFYERIFMMTNPVSNNSNSYYYKVAYAGIQLKVYPKMHKKATYFMSFGLDFGKAKARVLTNEIVYLTDIYGQTKIYLEKSINYYDSYFQSFSYINGFIFRPHKNFVLQCFGLIGLNRFIDPPPPSYWVQPKKEHATVFFRYGIGLSAGFAF